MLGQCCGFHQLPTYHDNVGPTSTQHVGPMHHHIEVTWGQCYIDRWLHVGLQSDDDALARFAFAPRPNELPTCWANVAIPTNKQRPFISIMTLAQPSANLQTPYFPYIVHSLSITPFLPTGPGPPNKLLQYQTPEGVPTPYCI